jgi:hypothetical protein
MTESEIYNYDVFQSKAGESSHFRSITHAGDIAPDFSLPSINGGPLTLSALRGMPVVIEFGSIT